MSPVLVSANKDNTRIHICIRISISISISQQREHTYSNLCCPKYAYMNTTNPITRLPGLGHGAEVLEELFVVNLLVSLDINAEENILERPRRYLRGGGGGGGGGNRV